jgi:hypothetical protein
MKELAPLLIGQVVPLLNAIFGLLAGIVVKSGKRRRLDNLKAGAETLKSVTDHRDAAAVRKYMDEQRVALSRTVDLRTWFLGSVALVVYVSLPLIPKIVAPGSDLWGYYAAPIVTLIVLGVVYVVLLDAKPLAIMLFTWAWRKRRSSSGSAADAAAE